MTVTKAPPSGVVAIIGSRDFKDLDKVRAFVRSLPKNACVISGGARGVDQAAEAEAFACGLSVRSYRPFAFGHRGQYRIEVVDNKERSYTSQMTLRGLYDSFTKAAHARNSMIVDGVVAGGGCVVAFWDGSSPGTLSVIAKARRAGVLFDVYVDGEPASLNESIIARMGGLA